jgi:hypothetical protein
MHPPVAQRCCQGLAAWQTGVEVQQAVALERRADWFAAQEALYARGMVPGLLTDTTSEESQS